MPTSPPDPATSGITGFDLIGFDLDGTLVDSAADIASATNHAIGLVGRPPLSVPTISSFMGAGTRRTLIRALVATATAGSPMTDGEDETALADRLLPEMLGYYAAHIADHTVPYSGVEAALDAFAAMGTRLAICTNKQEHLARSLIDALGWDGRFAAIVGGDTVGVLKPDPAPLAEMIAQAGGGKTLFVGDTDNDTLAAQAIGIPVVLFTSGHSEPIDPAALGADAIISDFADLPGVAQRLAEVAARPLTFGQSLGEKDQMLGGR